MSTKQPFASRWAMVLTYVCMAIGPEKFRCSARVVTKNDSGSALGSWLNLVSLRLIALLRVEFFTEKGCYSESYGGVWGTSQARE